MTIMVNLYNRIYLFKMKWQYKQEKIDAQKPVHDFS